MRTSMRMLKNLKEAVTSYGIHSPYVMGLLDSLMDTNMLLDWAISTLAQQQNCRAVLLIIRLCAMGALKQ
ncbi:hypothetical protein E2320_020159, partial [Naja naja]